MEAIADPHQERNDPSAALAQVPRLYGLPAPAAVVPAEAVGLAGAAHWVAAAALRAPDELAGAGYVEAAAFAIDVEALARTVDYLQILAAGAVDSTRTAAISAAATAGTRSATTAGKGWLTGWTTTNNPGQVETDANWPGPTPTPDLDPAPARVVPASPADDGCRNTAEFLRISLRIGITEARRRLHLAQNILPTTTITGASVPAPHQHLANALTPELPGPNEPGTEIGTTGPVGTAPLVSSRAGTIISTVLDRLRHHTTAEVLDLIEEHLTTTAATADPDFLARAARHWADTLDADGTEPTEEALRHTQGAFIRKPRHGLHHLEIFATTEQYEHLQTVMNIATNPRTHTPPTNTGTGAAPEAGLGQVMEPGLRAGKGQDPAPGEGQDVWLDGEIDLDRRTRSQKQLDGIISAIQAALTTNTLPTTGGNRPQILATINHKDLFPTPRNNAANTAGTGTGTGTLAFTGPVAAATIRKLACDADIIPVLLGSTSEILDLGRKTRLFSTSQRLALTARDQGCAFPNCTIPAPWCEAHHITYWSHNGPTNTNNGVLLCSHHHHVIHKEQWTITTTGGTSWFTPPKHIDPTQKPRQNHYFKPPRNPPTRPPAEHQRE